MTNYAEIKDMLQRLKPKLQQRFHVSEIGLFGSVVRDDFTPSSDIDIVVDFSKPVGIEFIDLANYIESKLMRPVDLVSRLGIKKSYFQAIESEIEYVKERRSPANRRHSGQRKKNQRLLIRFDTYDFPSGL